MIYTAETIKRILELADKQGWTNTPALADIIAAQLSDVRLAPATVVIDTRQPGAPRVEVYLNDNKGSLVPFSKVEAFVITDSSVIQPTYIDLASFDLVPKGDRSADTPIDALVQLTAKISGSLQNIEQTLKLIERKGK